jgi:phosphate transport system permease protein
MILPTIIRTTEEAIRAVPIELREGSFAMGATKWQTVMKVVLPAALGGVITGLILSIGRAAGETAPVLLTATTLMTNNVSNIFGRVSSLPTHLYNMYAEGVGTEAQMYGTALVLMILVLSMFALASYVRYRSEKKAKW